MSSSAHAGFSLVGTVGARTDPAPVLERPGLEQCFESEKKQAPEGACSLCLPSSDHSERSQNAEGCRSSSDERTDRPAPGQTATLARLVSFVLHLGFESAPTVLAHRRPKQSWVLRPAVLIATATLMHVSNQVFCYVEAICRLAWRPVIMRKSVNHTLHSVFG